ncbi:MAG: aspartyl protease family protein [Phycisphaerae bacterium]|nr:aspartyl protease family protein [Phycisphaerae bacterium]
MGRTVEKVTVQSLEDILDARKGKIEEAAIRTVEVEAVVDTGATYLCLPPSAIEQLGLPFSHVRRVQTANGDVQRRVFMGANITIQGRTEQMSVMENDESTPPLVGYLVLEALDFVVDPQANQLIPNPAHEGKWVADLY